MPKGVQVQVLFPAPAFRSLAALGISPADARWSRGDSLTPAKRLKFKSCSRHQLSRFLILMIEVAMTEALFQPYSTSKNQSQAGGWSAIIDYAEVCPVIGTHVQHASMPCRNLWLCRSADKEEWCLQSPKTARGFSLH